MDETYAVEVPETLEGWFILHDVYAIDWPRWTTLEAAERRAIAEEAQRWLSEAAGDETGGDSAAFSVLTQKGDLMLVHYRRTPDALNQAELQLRKTRLYGYLVPRYAYFSVIELGMYELTMVVRKRLADLEVHPGSDEYEEYFEHEMAKQKRRTQSRLFRRIPEHRYICFYPMSKRRGEQQNWYTLDMEDRRELMRGHGRIGHKYHERVTQVIGGSVGLDDWEWGVSLFAEDTVTFKKLIYEMRFDPASALYAEFGPFYIGIRVKPDQLPDLLEGRIEQPAAAVPENEPEQ